MDVLQKVEALKTLDTKALIVKLHQYEDGFEKAMIAEADFKNSNHGFLGIGDCLEVKRILAELSVKTPELDKDEKKMTAAGKEKWLIRQREENKELNDAISKQRQVVFLLDDHHIKVEMAKKRLEGIKVVLILKTAQINFLATG